MNPRHPRHSWISSLTHLLILLALLSEVFVPARPASAAAITVNSTLDSLSNDGLCTLREAVIAANKDAVSGKKPGECQAGSGADTISIPAGTFTLTRTDSGKEDAAATGDLDISADLTLKAGPGARVVVTGKPGFTDRIFHVIKGNVVLRDITIQGGNVSGDGGGVFNAAKLTLERTTLSGNNASARGGAIFNAPAAALTMTNSTFSSNRAGTQGGGLYQAGATTTLQYSTLAGNTAGQAGSGDNLFAASAGLAAKAVLFAVPGSGGNCSGNFTSNGYNLSSDSSCAASLTKPSDVNAADPLLGPLQDNGGFIFTRAPGPGSPAIDRAEASGCPMVDQRGKNRPQGAACDIGAVEVELMAQAGPVYTVNTAADPGDGLCAPSNCSLRSALLAANAHPNGASPDQIRFAIPGAGAPVIPVATALPAVTDPLVIDGATQQPGGSVELDGRAAGVGVDGLIISSGGSTLRGLTLRGFSGSGIVLKTNGGNLVEGNTITANGGSGVVILSGTGNLVQSNHIYGNAGLAIDLGGDGPTPNDADDPDQGPNTLQNFPVLQRAVSANGSTAINGRLNSLPATIFTIEFFASPQCGSGGAQQGQVSIGKFTGATTDSQGNLYFNFSVLADTAGQFISAVATGPGGNTSELSPCVAASIAANDSWPHALELAAASASASQYIDQPGQSRWYKFKVQPGSKVLVTLTGLPADYDLTMYKDIRQAFRPLGSTGDLVRLGAEFAPDAFSPDAFSPDAFSPDAFSPDAFSPDAFSPDAFSPDAFSPDAFSPDAFSPDAFSPDAFSPDAFSPDAFSPDAFSSAQTRSLIAISAFEGVASEGLLVNTWDRSGDFYLRVRGRNGAYSLAAPFTLNVSLVSDGCNALPTGLPGSNSTAVSGGFKTIILADPSRLPGAAEEQAALNGRLASFAARPEVKGVLVNVGADNRVAALNAWSDANPACPQGKNLVAYAIKDIVGAYRQLNPLEYVVVVGGDGVIPFFRHPDQALLASEKNYVPPVLDNTASQASLRLGYVLSQDRYGALYDISVKDDMFPISALAVGRLVETAAEATRVLDAYLATANGVAPAPNSALVSGYDFLADGADAVRAELAAGLGAPPDTLIAPRDLSPLDPAAWTAADLQAQLLGRRHDVVYLAGHFSAGSALAADYRTRLLASQVADATIDLTNALIFSAGCHAGYNLVDPHAVVNVTQQPDWAQAFARKGATLIAGTGYQYGDTDFVEYSERLYLAFARQLRAGSGPVAIGKALVAAKNAYLADTPQLRGIHEKALLEATLFGLPMLSLNLPAGRGTPQVDPSIVTGTAQVSTNPGAALGLSYANVTLSANDLALQQHTVILTDPQDRSVPTAQATYFSGSNGVVARPSEPVLPLVVRNVSVNSAVLRGVGFRGGAYSDLPGVIPLTGAATTEIRGVHPPFLSQVFYPVGLWNVNYFAALPGLGAGITRLMVTPAQYRSTASGMTDGTLRAYNELSLRLYYSSNTAIYGGGSQPALAAAPSIVQVNAASNGSRVAFRVRAAGNPAAGIQSVWVTYTATGGPLAGRWQSLDLLQNGGDSTLWQGDLDLAGTPTGDLRFIVQAVNGVGLVSLASNQGRYYIPGGDPAPAQPAELSIAGQPASGPYGSQAAFTATLTSNGTPLASELLYFSLGAQRRQAVTDSAGRAMVDLPLLGRVGEPEQVRVSYPGTATYAPAAARRPFTITQQATSLAFQPASASGYADNPALITATLTDAAGRPLLEKTVIFVVQGMAGSASVAAITNFSGQAVLGSLPLPPGGYTVRAFFGGEVTLDDGLTVLNLRDERYAPSEASASLSLLNPPICDAASPSPGFIWPPNNNFYPVTITGVTDADGDPITIQVTSIFQDERVGTGNQSPDGLGVGTPTAQVRAERDGGGDGRVYHIRFTASDGKGGACSAVVRIGVVDNQGTPLDPIDGGPLYDSTLPSP